MREGELTRGEGERGTGRIRESDREKREERKREGQRERDQEKERKRGSMLRGRNGLYFEGERER